MALKLEISIKFPEKFAIKLLPKITYAISLGSVFKATIITSLFDVSRMNKTDKNAVHP
jgi:hypothetical protein